MSPLRATLGLLLCACSGTIMSPSPSVPGELAGPGSDPSLDTPIIHLPAAVACNGASVGRSYHGFAGETLDANRLPLGGGQDLARVRDGSDLGTQFGGRSLDLANVTRSDAQAFGVAPSNWYEPAEASFATAYRVYALGFEGCLKKLKNPANYHPFGHADFASAPTTESATRQCQKMGQIMWWRDMTPEELAPCVEYAEEVRSLEPVPQRQWAYVCAAVAGSAGFLVY